MAARFDAVRLFIFVLILLIQPHFTLRLKGRPFHCWFEGVCTVQVTTHSFFTWHWPGLDSFLNMRFSCSTLDGVLYQLLRV